MQFAKIISALKNLQRNTLKSQCSIQIQKKKEIQLLKLELKEESYKIVKFWAEGNKEDFRCSECGRFVSEGFCCENDLEIVLCAKDQANFNMMKCKHDLEGNHRHIKFIKREKDGN